jgi:hypothetical protein
MVTDVSESNTLSIFSVEAHHLETPVTTSHTTKYHKLEDHNMKHPKSVRLFVLFSG